MKKIFKKSFKLVLSFLAMMSLFVGGFVTVNAEETTDTVAPTEPEKPNVDGLDAEQANELIETYNKEVDEYNAQVDSYNQSIESKFSEEEIAAQEHNASEDAKVVENEKAIATATTNNNYYNSIQDWIKIFDERGIQQNRTTNGADIPTSWDSVTSGDLKTIEVTKSDNPSNERYRVINLHIYVDEKSDAGFYVPNVYDENFSITKSILDHVVLAEWEITEVDKMDDVRVECQAKDMGYSSAAFYRYMDGYTNGYWIPTTQFVSTCVNAKWSLFGENFSYKDGTVDGKPIKNVFNLNLYNFHRVGREVTYMDVPDVYTANYITAEKGGLLSHIDYMDLIEITEDPTTPGVPTPPVTVTPGPDAPVPASTPVAIATVTTTAPATTTAVLPTDTPSVVERIEDGTTPLAGTEEIKDNATPLVGTEEIKDNATPLAKAEGSWALVNLIAAVITVLLGIIMLLAKHKKEEDEEDEDYAYNEDNTEEYKRRRWTKVLGILVSVLSIVIFILTEDMTLPLVMVDKWTLLMVVLTIINAVVLFVGRKWKNNSDEQNKELQTA